MLKYVNNGSAEPKFTISAKYLSTTGNISIGSTGKYKINSGSLVVMKLDISQFDTRFKAVKTALKLKIESIDSSTQFKLYLIDATRFGKKNSLDISTYDSELIDAIYYEGKPNLYKAIDEVLEFDLSKHFYNLLSSSTKTVYFALRSTNRSFEIYDIASLFTQEAVIDMQINQMMGLEAMYEYDQESVGFAGISSINLANGKLIHKIEPIQTSNEKHPAVFHAFFNRDHLSDSKILGKYWHFSGEYTIDLNESKGTIQLTDPTQKILILQQCKEEDIKELYDMDAIDPFDGTYYACLTEPMYCIVQKSNKNTMIFVDKNNNQMHFETSYRRITKIALSTGKTITYDYDNNNRPIKITDGSQEYLTISYLNGIVRVEHYSKKNVLLAKVDFYVALDRITSVKTYLGNGSTVVNEATFGYDANGRLTSIIDKTSAIGSTISYSSTDQVVKVTHDYIGDPDEQQYTSYDYFTFQTRITDYTGFYTDYYFDYYGRCKNIVDSEAKSITRNYEDVIDGKPGNLTAESKLQVNERNLIDNSSFDSADKLFDNDSSWQLVSGDQSLLKIVDGGVFGQKCLRVEKQASTIELKQKIYYPPAGTYTLKSFFKAIAGPNSYLTRDSIKVTVNVSYKEQVTTTTTIATNSYTGGKSKSNSTGTLVSTTKTYQRNKEYSVSNFLSGTFDWNGFEQTGVVIPSGSNISDVNVEVHLIFEGSRYTAFVDDISLSYGDHNVRYNYVNNGYLEERRNGWSFSSDEVDDFITCNETDHPTVLGSSVLRITSDLSQVKSMYRRININGGAGEELLFTLFGKGNISKNDLFQAYIQIHYVDTSQYVLNEFDFDSNFEHWQVLTRKIVTEGAFDFVYIGVQARAKCNVYVDAIQLYKDSFGKEYSYTEKKNMTEMVDANGNCANISYDSDSNVTEATDESGDTYRYTYNDKKQVTQITNNQNTKVLFKYEGDNKTETKIISTSGETLKTNEGYDEEDRLIYQVDDMGVRTDFAYDSLSRKSKRTDANGLITTYQYDLYNQLKEQLASLAGDRSKCTYTYNSKGNIDTITTDNGTVYSFTYTVDQQVAVIRVNGNIIAQNQYTKKINGINTNLLTKQYLGPDATSGYYDYIYDQKQRLTSIKFNNVVQVTYVYNERNQVSEIYDAVQGCHHFLSYDSNGQIISVTDTEGNHFAYDYDNLKNLQKLTMSIDGILRSFDYEYKCEYNDYTPSGYFARLQKAFPDEIIKGGSGYNGVYGGKAYLNTVRYKNTDVIDELPLGDTVASLSFKQDNAVIAYDTTTFNKERKAESTAQKVFNWERWKSAFSTRKVVYAWIKPTNTIDDTQRILAFATQEASGFRFTLSALTNGKIEIRDSVTKQVLTSTNTLKLGTWNLIGMKLDYQIQGNQRLVTLVLNDEIKSIGYYDKSYISDLKYFILGAPSASLNLSDLYALGKSGIVNNQKTYPIPMKFRVAFASVGSTDITEKDFEGIYAEGQKYLLNDPNYGASGVTYFNPKVYEGYDVIPLNGSLTSMKRMKPKTYSFTEGSFKVEKSRMFKFDQTGQSPLYRHVYASYDGLTNLNKGNPSKLAYDLLLGQEGTINLRFKVDELNSDERVVLYSTRNSQQKMKLFVYENYILFQGNDPTPANSYIVGEISAGEWIHGSIRFDNDGSVEVQMDLENIHLENYHIDLEDAWTYFGCEVDANKKPIHHLNGCIEMISFKDSCATEAEFDHIRLNGESISIRNYYDELGRTSVQKIHTERNVLSKQITYKNNGSNTTTKVASEQLYNGEKLVYEYDAVGNVLSIQRKRSDDTVLDSKEYVYDGLSRLKSSTINGTVHSYTYDTNNNIISKDGITYTYDSVIKDRLIGRSDGTTITYEDRIIGNPTQIKKPNKTLNFTWHGRRLMAINDTTYSYNYNGLRLEKQIKDGFNEKYYINGDTIIALKRTQNQTTKFLSFVYDETQSLVGLSLNDKEYFYDRNTRGEIQRIIDKNGTILVEYHYDDWGKPTWTVPNLSAEGQELAELNPFLYKGYFYDQDTQLYYLKKRYYDPELGRFISADSEVGSIGDTMNMNLYAYCRCNPISYADENGDWPKWLTKVCIGLAVIAVCAVVAVATAGTGAACLGMSMFVGALKGAAIGAIQGALSGAIMGAITEGIRTGSWEGAFKGAISGAVNGAADGFMFGAIGGAVSGAMNPKFCFIGGTLVMTKQGLKAIEEIKQGDQVLAYNENLGLFDYKDVVDVYKNETSELCHIHTEQEEIVCTPNHNILTKEGWKQADELVESDWIQTESGFEKVISIEKETLDNPVPVYNFNVLGYHTYVVGNTLLIVHNRCKLGENMEKSGNIGQPGQDAHHLFPQKFRKDFKKIGIDIDEVKYGRWIDLNKHRQGAFAYNKLWDQALTSGRVTIDNAMDFAKNFMKQIYNMVI